MLNALNEVLRDDFIRDSAAGVGRWNRVIEKAGLAFRLTLPHKAFNRHIGTFAGHAGQPRRPRHLRSRMAGARARVAGVAKKTAPTSRR